MSKRLNLTRQSFLLTFFDQDEYQEKEVNGFWLVKHKNNNNGRWEVSIYSQPAFDDYKGLKSVV